VEPVTQYKSRWLVVVALASLGLYLYLAVQYPIGPSLANPRASWTSMVSPSAINAARHLAIYLGLTLLYVAALRLLTPGQVENGASPGRQIRLIFAVWLACSGVLMFVAPAGESHDIFDYLFRGRMMTQYQANPLVDVPESFGLSAPFTRYLAWRKSVDTYGPIWEGSSFAVSSGVRQVASWLGWWDDTYPVCPKSPESCRLLIAYVTGYRLLAISLTGVSGLLIAAIVRRSQVELVPLSLAAWLWSPLTLIATTVGGHNDALMLALTFLSWWLIQRQRIFWALMALVLAAHVKLTALIWLPVCALWIVWRYGWRLALKIGLASAASGLALSWLLYAPFGGWQTLPRMLEERAAFLANSLWAILKEWLKNAWGWSTESAIRLSTRLPNWLFSLSVLLAALWMFNFRPKRWRNAPISLEEAYRTLWRALVVVSMLYLVLGSFWFQHWYVLWVLAPAVLLPESLFTRSVLPWLGFGALSSNVAMDFLFATAIKTAPPITGNILSVGIIWGPILIYTGVLALARRRSRPLDLQAAWRNS
jgi:hypothetical protein